MKRFYFLFTAIFILSIASSCNKADAMSYDRVVDKITGEWTVHKVKLTNNRKVFNDNVTEIYEDFIFDFESDGQMTLMNPRENITYPGIWYVDEIYTWDAEDQEQDISYILHMHVIDPVDPELYRIMRWKDLKISNGRLIGKESIDTDDGKRHKYRYELKK